MKRKTKKKSSTKPQGKEEKWDGAKNATKPTREPGTKSVSWRLIKLLSPRDSFFEKVAADIPDLRNEIDEQWRWEGLNHVLDNLPGRQGMVLKMRFFNEMSLLQISQVLGVSRERIRQIEAKGLRHLRHPQIKEKLRQFDIPIEEEWYPKKEIIINVEATDYIPPKPQWVKAEFTEDGVPYLAADSSYIWCIKPVTLKVYDNWLSQTMEEHEAIHRP